MAQDLDFTLNIPSLIGHLSHLPCRLRSSWKMSRQFGQSCTRIAAAKAAIQAIERAQHKLAEDQPDADLYADAAVRLMDLHRERIEGCSQTGDAAALVKRIDGVERKLRLAALRAERDEIFRTARARKIEDDIARKLVREIDLLEARYV